MFVFGVLFVVCGVLCCCLVVCSFFGEHCMWSVSVAYGGVLVCLVVFVGFGCARLYVVVIGWIWPYMGEIGRIRL